MAPPIPTSGGPSSSWIAPKPTSSHLNRDTIDRAIDLLLAAHRIEFFALGHYGVVAQDAQFKFLRFGMPCGAYTDPRLQLLAADVLREGDVAVVISSGGRLPELIAVVEKAQERGAKVVAITASQSPLAKKADLTLIVDHIEDIATHLPMVSRILHLLVIDILAVGVAMRRSPDSIAALTAGGEDDDAKGSRGAGATAPGVSTASPLARLTSHSR